MLIEDAKRTLEKLTGIGRPGAGDIAARLRTRKALLLRFKDDGYTPNNPKLPLILYRSPIRLSGAVDPSAVMEEMFAANGWKDAWRGSIYDFLHFHSHTHEALGIARGHAKIQFGGIYGKVLSLKAGDVVVQPAGTGHQRKEVSKDFLVVGAYPPGARYDEPRPDQVDHAKAVAAIRKVRVPANDPVYGSQGPLVSLWRGR